MKTTALRVRELLRERRWTTKVLAEKTGMSESYLTHIKNGTRRWNEDALDKLSRAFEIEPTDLFSFRKERTDNVDSRLQFIGQDLDSTNANLQIKVVPVVGQIPSQPSAYNNQVLQATTGYKDKFVPVFADDGNKDADAMFCLSIKDNSLAPRFVNGDYLVICPGLWTKSGDIVAVEYGDEQNPQKEIMQINYMDDFVVLESVNHKKAPVALVRGKDNFRVIGKVTHRYQMMA
ncbi:MAG: helix-turn-helix domain-containing protein [bacterium]